MAGRMMSKRVMGKASFADLRDRTGDIQMYIRRDDVGTEEYQAFKKFDIGDIVGVKGFVFRTKMGEISVHVKEIVLLSKSLLPLPEKFHGLKDTETRYRQRYVDLLVNPDVKETFVKRSAILRELRSYLDGKGFLEVETPILTPFEIGAAEMCIRDRLVGDENNAFALFFELANDGEKLLHFLFGQGRGGFVHDDDLGVECHCFGNLHHLLFTDAQIAYIGGGLSVRQVNFCQKFFCALVHGGVIHHVSRSHFFAGQTAHENIFTNVQPVDHTQFLIDDADAAFRGQMRCEAFVFFSVQNNGSFIRCVGAAQHLHQCGFAGTVFAKQHVDFTGLHIKVDVVQRHDTRKALGDSVHLDNGLHRVLPLQKIV